MSNGLHKLILWVRQMKRFDTEAFYYEIPLKYQSLIISSKSVIYEAASQNHALWKYLTFKIGDIFQECDICIFILINLRKVS